MTTADSLLRYHKFLKQVQGVVCWCRLAAFYSWTTRVAPPTPDFLLRASRREDCDVAPLSALGLNWTPSKGDGDEEESIQRRADHRGSEGVLGGDSNVGALPEARISDATFYNWRNRHGGMEVSDARRLKSLEDENRKLKKLLAESMLDVATLREALGKKLLRPGSRRACVTWAMAEKTYSQRRACGLIGLAPKTFRYASRRSDNLELRARLKGLASERRRFGYRRVRILLRREGIALNHKKLFRLYREERLPVRRRGGRKRALGTRSPMGLPQGKNQRWSLDFVADTLDSGRRFRILVVVDDFTRECLALVVDTSLSGLRLARELDRLVTERSCPLMIVSDNGTEVTSRAILQWQEDRGVD